MLFVILFIFLLVAFSYGTGELLKQPAKFITRFPFKQLSGGVMLVQARFEQYTRHP